MPSNAIDRFYGVQDVQGTPTLDALLGQPESVAQAVPLAPVSDKDQATSFLNAALAQAAARGDIVRTPDVAYRSGVFPLSVTTDHHIVPDGHAGIVHGAYDQLAGLPDLARTIANEPVMTMDLDGRITDAGGVGGAGTAGALEAAATIGAGGYASPKPSGAVGAFGGNLGDSSWMASMLEKMSADAPASAAVPYGGDIDVALASLKKSGPFAAPKKTIAQMSDDEAAALASAWGKIDAMPQRAPIDFAQHVRPIDWQDYVPPEGAHPLPNAWDNADFVAGRNRAWDLGYNTQVPLFKGMGWHEKSGAGLGESGGFADPATKPNERAIFAADQPRVAQSYANSYNLAPMYARADNAHAVDWRDIAPSGSYDGSIMQQLIDHARGQGIDALAIHNIGDLGGMQTQYAFMDPTKLRVRHAAFSPDAVNSADLLSSQAPPVVLPPPDDTGHAKKMADGLFDDLIPSEPQPTSDGRGQSPHPLFDDLVPQYQPDGAPPDVRNVPTAKSDPIYHGAVPIAAVPDQGATTAFASGVGGVPIVGPAILRGVQDAAAYGRSLKSGTDYDAEREHVRDMTDAARQQHPVAAFAGDVTGAGAALAPAVAAAPVVFGVGPGGLTAGKIAAGAASGAALGGADAAVRSDGDPASIARGAGGGAVGGALGPALGAVGSKVGQSLASLAGRAFAPNPGVAQPVADIISRAAANDGRLGAEGLANINASGEHGMMVDASPSLASVLDTALQHGGPGTAAAREAIEARSAASNQEMTGALDRAFGPAQGINDATDALRGNSAAARAAAYDRAYSTPIDYSSPAGRTVEQIISNRVPAGIIARAQRQMQVDGALPPQQTMASIGADGKVTYTAMPDVRMVDYVTRALNDVAKAGDGQGALGGNTAEGRSYGMLAQDLRGALRSAVPEYGNALDTAAQPIQARDALEFGANMLSPTVPRDIVASTVHAMTKPELDQVRAGVRSQIADTLANVRRTISDPNVDARQAMDTVKMLSSDAASDKISVLLHPAEKRSLDVALDRVSRALDLRAAVSRNSATYGRGVTGQTIDKATEPGLVKQALTAGGPLKATRPIAQYLTGTRPQDIALKQDALYGQLATALTEPRGADAAGLFTRLMRGQQARDTASSIAGAIPYGALSQAGMLALMPPIQSRLQ